MGHVAQMYENRTCFKNGYKILVENMTIRDYWRRRYGDNIKINLKK
jgi:hypothetical protein